LQFVFMFAILRFLIVSLATDQWNSTLCLVLIIVYGGQL
jgi:hypothetical protein